ncbi:hypothetical protein KFE25_005151 [Diacronema lutheri]|uniref:Uncharacterized protein n=1 Tax=Diacronema lutheri TaxID=2081491 RepID=A0A8J6C2B6_DIALT|nr:hypothetical protein KFE25_005151 [Diacronema lutheri]
MRGARRALVALVALAALAALAPARGAVLLSAAPRAAAVPAPHRASRSAPRAAAGARAAPDPYELVAEDIARMKQNLREVATLNAGPNPTGVAASQPVLTMAVQEFLKRPGKSFRPMVVLLLGRAAAATARARALEGAQTAEVLHAKHMRLAELTEMMNVASIIHDDVMDDEVLPAQPDVAHDARNAQDAHRRAHAGAQGGSTARGAQPGAPSADAMPMPVSGVDGNIVHKMYSANVGNKVSILAGDFLLARAAVELAQLDDPAVVEIMAGALESIVRGGMLRSESLAPHELSVRAYEQRTQARSAQLLANSCRCAALLTGYGHTSDEAAAAEAFGCHLGMAAAIAADCREFAEGVMRADPQSATLVGAPSVVSLLAAEDRPALLPVVSRQARSQADVAELVAAVHATGAMDAARRLAAAHAASATAALERFCESDARAALAGLCQSVLL